MALKNLKRIYDQDQNKAVQLLCKPVKRIFGGSFSGKQQDSLFELNLKYFVFLKLNSKSSFKVGIKN